MFATRFQITHDLSMAKWAFATRRVNRGDIKSLRTDFENAVPGDLLLGEVAAIGQHQKIQLADARYAALNPGDIVVMVVGDRYSPGSFEGFSIIGASECDMIASGGIVGQMKLGHDNISKPTKIRPIGLLADAGGDVLNLASYSIKPATIPEDVLVIGVFGASANAGKTTAAVSLAHGLRKAGYAVEAVKATGASAFATSNTFRAAGIPLTDFTDAGMGTTHRMPMDRVEAGFAALVGGAASRGAKVVVVEFADGVFQDETQQILKGGVVKDRLNGTLFASQDTLGAMGGLYVMHQCGLRPFAISGMVTRSPHAIREVERTTGATLLSRDRLSNPYALLPVMRSLLPAGVRRVVKMGAEYRGLAA